MAIFTHFHIRCVLKKEYVDIVKKFCLTGHWVVPSMRPLNPIYYCICDWLGFLRFAGHFRVLAEGGIECPAQKRMIRNSLFRHDKLEKYIQNHPVLDVEYDPIPWGDPPVHAVGEFHPSHCELSRETSTEYLWTLIGDIRNENAEIEKFINLVLLNVSPSGGVRRCWLSNAMLPEGSYYDLTDTYLRENNIYVTEPPPPVQVVFDDGDDSDDLIGLAFV